MECGSIAAASCLVRHWNNHLTPERQIISYPGYISKFINRFLLL